MVISVRETVESTATSPPCYAPGLHAVRLADGQIYYVMSDGTLLWLDWEIAQRQGVAPSYDSLSYYLDREWVGQSSLLPVTELAPDKSLAVHQFRTTSGASPRLALSDAPVKTITKVHKRQVLERL